MTKIKLEPSENNQKKAPSKNFIKIAAILFFLILILEIWLVNRLSTSGDKLNEIKAAKANLELQNQLLENKIAEEIALVKIEQKSALFGFTNIKNLEYIK